MADSKVAALTADPSPVATDIVYVVHDPGGAPGDRKVELGNLLGAIGATPAGTSVAIASGLVYDGTTDNATALLAAANAAVAAGLPLVTTAGTLKVATTVVLPAGLTWHAFGTVLSGAIVGDALVTLGSNTIIQGLSATNTDVSTGNIGFDIRASASRIIIDKCKFTGQKVQAVWMASAGISNVLVTGCTFDGVSYGVGSNSGGTTGSPTGAWDLLDVRVIGNRFLNIYGDAVGFNHPINSGADGTLSGASGFVVSGNVMAVPNGSGVSSGFCVAVAGGQDVTISDNVILLSRLEGIHIEDDSRRVTITGNTIKSSPVGISLGSSVVDMLVEGNTVDTATSFGIVVVYAATTAESTDITIIGNTIRNVTAGPGISVGGDATLATRYVVANNIIRTVNTHGIELLGAVDVLTVHGNIIQAATQYGIHAASGSPGRLWDIRNNVITACTAGDYDGVVIASGGATPLTNRTARFVSGTSSGGVAAASLFRLGRYAEGILRVGGRVTSAPTNRGEAVYRIRWNGSTLSFHQQHSANSGSFDTDGGALKMVSGVLTWQAYTVTDPLTVTGMAVFDGIIIEDGAGTASVTGTSMTVAAAATDLASVITLANDLRTKLTSLGHVG